MADDSQWADMADDQETYTAGVQLRYKGYRGSVEFSAPDNCWHGEILNVVKRDMITYESDTKEGLQAAFEEVVDDYVEFCKNFRPSTFIFEHLTRRWNQIKEEIILLHGR